MIIVCTQNRRQSFWDFCSGEERGIRAWLAGRLYLRESWGLEGSRVREPHMTEQKLWHAERKLGKPTFPAQCPGAELSAEVG